MPVAYLCDFDGTVAPEDIGAAWVVRHSPVAETVRRALLERWKHGEIGSRELTVAECAGLRCTRAEAIAFTRTFTLDPSFAPFAREAQDRGDAVMVVSDGFDFYVADHLARAGLGDLPWAANHVRFDEDGAITLEFPHTGGCGRCGNCKAPHVQRYRAMGYTTVLVGDGFSDRCAARVADHVLARGGLLEWTRAQSIAAREILDFTAVAAFARELADGRGAEPRAGIGT